MTSKQLTILILLALYILTIGCLTIYHAFNFTDYVHRKGDETMDYMWFLLLTSILFQGLIWMITGVFDWRPVILGTIVNFILSAILGFAILLVTELSGIPRHLILIYGGCFLTFFATVTIIQSNKLVKKSSF